LLLQLDRTILGPVSSLVLILLSDPALQRRANCGKSADRLHSLRVRKRASLVFVVVERARSIFQRCRHNHENFLFQRIELQFIILLLVCLSSCTCTDRSSSRSLTLNSYRTNWLSQECDDLAMSTLSASGRALQTSARTNPGE
jgi:hypothetical protein